MDGGTLLAAQAIDTGAPRLDLAGDFEEFFLVLRLARTTLAPEWSSPQGSYRQHSSERSRILWRLDVTILA
jgi:hypothetical protein